MFGPNPYFSFQRFSCCFIVWFKKLTLILNNPKKQLNKMKQVNELPFGHHLTY